MSGARDDMLDLLLDSFPDSPEHERARRAIDADPELASLASLQAEIDARLRARLAPPAPACPFERSPWTRRLALGALAAGVVLALATGYWFWGGRGPRTLDPGHRLAAIFERARLGNMTPRWVCTTEEEFVATTRDRLGQGIACSARGSLVLLGWDYDYLFTDQTCVLLARDQGRDVVVVMDRADRERAFDLDLGRGVGVSRRVLGRVVLYEIRADEGPSVLDLFHEP